MGLLLTDGNLRATLAAVRGLGQAGIEVTVAAETAASLAGSSRYCAARVLSPSPGDEPRAFADFLRREIASGAYEVVLPMSDVSLRIAADALADYPAATRCIPFPGGEVIAAVQDKSGVLRVARGLGMDCPREFVPDGRSLEEFARNLPYPVVLKPVRSRHERDGRWHAASVSYAADPAEFLARYAAARESGPGLMAQEYVRGEGRGVFLLMWDGEVKAAFCHRRLREKPPWGGVSVLSESLPHDAELVRHSAALLRELKWRGPAMVEFKVDRDSGRAVLMEINGRFWGSLQLAIDAGVNFPYLLYRLAAGASLEPVLDYRVGLRSRWLLGDVAQLIARLRSPRKARQFAPGDSLLGAAGSLFRSLGPLRYESPRRGDLGPFTHELRMLAHKLVGGAGRPGHHPARAAAVVKHTEEAKA